MKARREKNQPIPPPAPARNAGNVPLDELSGRARIWLWIALATLLTILGLRMTMSESVRETITMKSATLMAAGNPASIATAPAVGPTVTIGLAILTFACAGIITLCLSGKKSGISIPALLGLLAIALFAAFGVASSFQAASKFIALVGTIDIVMALTAGWAVCVACSDKALGLAGRRLVLMVVAALLITWIAKGMLQRFDEIPQLREFYKQNKNAVLHQQGLKPGDPGIVLWEGRLFSGEVTGFVTFSNNVASGLIGMVAIALAAFLATLRGSKKLRDRDALEVTSAASLAILAIVGLLVIRWTNSRGGLLIAQLVAFLIVAGYLARGYVARFRWLLTTLAMVLLFAGAAAAIGYGLKHDNLREKSMTFRWFYWTGAAPMIQQSPLLGVGVHNFGDYYLTTKRPSAPEDVKDPHSTFVRLAAELGIPAAILFAGLIAWFAYRTISRRPQDAILETDGGAAIRPNALLALFIPIVLAWWIAQPVISSPEAAWYAILATGYGILALLAGGMIWLVTRDITTEKMRIIQAAALAGAAGMLLYDQINMALVTGPVAMFFWMLLGFSGSSATGGKLAAPLLARATGVALVLVTLATAVIVWIPVTRQSFAWDPAPYEFETLRALPGPDLRTAKASIDKAVALSPRSLDVLRLQMHVWNEMGLPTADLIRNLLAIDRSNARPRVDFTLNNENLSREERIRYLEEALAADAALAPDEPKRLTPEMVSTVQKKILELKARP